MSNELDFFKKEYSDSVRLFLFYQESKFSIFQAAKNAKEAERHRYMANYYFGEIMKLTGKPAAK